MQTNSHAQPEKSVAICYHKRMPKKVARNGQLNPFLLPQALRQLGCVEKKPNQQVDLRPYELRQKLINLHLSRCVKPSEQRQHHRTNQH